MAPMYELCAKAALIPLILLQITDYVIPVSAKTTPKSNLKIK